MRQKTGGWRECPPDLTAELHRREGERTRRGQHTARLASLAAAVVVLLAVSLWSSTSASARFPQREGFDTYREEYEEKYSAATINRGIPLPAKRTHDLSALNVSALIEDDIVPADAALLLRLQSLRERRSAAVSERRYQSDPLNEEILVLCREIHELENTIVDSKRARFAHRLRIRSLPVALPLLAVCAAAFVLVPRRLHEQYKRFLVQPLCGVNAKCVFKERDTNRYYHSCQASFRTESGALIGPVNISGKIYDKLFGGGTVLLVSLEGSEQPFDYIYIDLHL